MSNTNVCVFLTKDDQETRGVTICPTAVLSSGRNLDPFPAGVRLRTTGRVMPLVRRTCSLGLPVVTSRLLHLPGRVLPVASHVSVSSKQSVPRYVCRTHLLHFFGSILATGDVTNCHGGLQWAAPSCVMTSQWGSLSAAAFTLHGHTKQGVICSAGNIIQLWPFFF